VKDNPLIGPSEVKVGVLGHTVEEQVTKTNLLYRDSLIAFPRTQMAKLKALASTFFMAGCKAAWQLGLRCAECAQAAMGTGQQS
jgi:hypothetical protein